MMNLDKAGELICATCGKCCRYMTFILEFSPIEAKDRIEFYETRGSKVYKLPNNKYAVRVFSPCSFMVEGVGCRIYNDRPWLCQTYDGRTDPFLNCPLTKGEANVQNSTGSTDDQRDRQQDE